MSQLNLSSMQKTLEMANNNYWQETLVPFPTIFQTIGKKPIILSQDIQIKYYQNVFDILGSEKVEYEAWLRYYKLLKGKLRLNALTPQLTDLFATTLINSNVIRKSPNDEVSYQEQYGDLLGIIESFNISAGQTRS